MYRLKISTKAKKEIKQIKSIHKKAILFALVDIKEDPLSGKPLINELTGRFSYRVGTYRIIYRVNKQNKTIYILKAGHRANVYQ